MLEIRSSQQQQRHKQRQRHRGVVDSKPWISDSQQQRQKQQQRGNEQGQGHGLSSFSSSLSPPRPAPPPLAGDSTNVTGNCGNVDSVLFNNLVEMVPLIESLMDRRGKSSFTRRASMIYTPAPSPKKKNAESKSRKASQTASTKNNREIGGDISNKNTADDFSIVSPRSVEAEKDREGINLLREQVDELQKKLLEKDESLKSAEGSLLSVQEALDDLKRQIVEKDSLIKSSQSQLNNTKISLADKQAAVEKLEWENSEARGKIEKLNCNLASVDFEIDAFMQIFRELSKNDSVAPLDEDVNCFDHFDHLPTIDLDETAIEEARVAYEAALVFAKNNPGEEGLALASEARRRLHSFVI